MANPNPPPPTIRALLIDISGTLLVGSTPIPGAVHALAKLRAANVPFSLCSNTSKESSDAVHERMRAAGLDVRREELWTSVGALGAVLKELGVKRPYALLSKSALEECTADDSESLRTSRSTDYDAVVVGLAPSLLDYDAVVVGLAPSLLDYAHLNDAFRILVGEYHRHDGPPTCPQDQHPGPVLEASTTTPPSQRKKVPLIALHKARYLEASDHALSLGPGPFITALEDAARTSAIVVGKPTRTFFETVLRDLFNRCGARAPDLDGDGPATPWRWNDGDGPNDPAAGRIAVIGDDVHADLGDGAIELGLWRVLVKTGKYRAGDEERSDAKPPDQVCASFAEFVDAMLEQRKQQQ